MFLIQRHDNVNKDEGSKCPLLLNTQCAKTSQCATRGVHLFSLNVFMAILSPFHMYLRVCMRVWVCVHMKVRGQFEGELVLSFHHVSSGAWWQAPFTPEQPSYSNHVTPSTFYSWAMGQAGLSVFQKQQSLECIIHLSCIRATRVKGQAEAQRAVRRGTESPHSASPCFSKIKLGQTVFQALHHC